MMDVVKTTRVHVGYVGTKVQLEELRHLLGLDLTQAGDIGSCAIRGTVIVNCPGIARRRY